MRKIITFNMISIDGYFEAPNRDISWHNVDQEFNELAIQQLNSVDALLFGRITYQFMATYWPSPDGLKDDPVVAGLMNDKLKVVISTTLTHPTWANSHLISRNINKELLNLKSQPGKDLIIFGSGILSTSLGNAGLIDEYRLMVNPILLGSGRSFFDGLHEHRHLDLLSTRKFTNGNVLITYQPVES